MGVIKRVTKPKTHKGKKFLKSREPMLIEGVKQTLFIKGRKTSDALRELMKDLHKIKAPDCIMFQKKNDIVPFEDITRIENFARKNNCPLFIFGSHTKKRPNNLIIGRMYEHNLLDMFELEVSQFKSLREFQNPKIMNGTKPCLVFSGPQWEQSAELIRLRSMLIDCFHREPVAKIRLQGLEHVISCTIDNNSKILFRSYKIQLKKSGQRTPRIELEEIGPSFDLKIRRHKLATDDLFKLACRQPKELKVKPKSNISMDNLGTKHGRIHMGEQGLNRIQTRKVKALRKTATEKKEQRKMHRKQSNDSGVSVNTNKNE